MPRRPQHLTIARIGLSGGDLVQRAHPCVQLQGVTPPGVNSACRLHLAWDEGILISPQQKRFAKLDLKVSSVSYFDDRCGKRFRVSEFEVALSRFWDKLGEYRPRQHVLGNWSLARSAQAYLAAYARLRGNPRPKPPGSVRLFAVAATLCMLPGIASAQDVGRAGTGGSFFDDFATLDRNRWFVSNGWSNGDYQNCTWSVDSVRALKHSLELLLMDQPSGERLFTCGELQTNEFYGYGTYEVRTRAAAAPGLVTAFFTYTGPPHGAGKPHDEVDFEFLGKDPKAVQLNYFANGLGKHQRVITFGFDATTTMNDYAFEWMPDSLRWFVNGELVHEVKRGPDEPFPTNPGKIYLSIWNGKGRDTEAWLGRFEYPGVPVVATYEHVAFTEAGQACQFPTSIVCTRGTSRFRSSTD